MTTILLVPMQLDALVLGEARAVVEAMADFSRLPFSTTARDVRYDVAYVSESIVSQPFQDEGLSLKPGVHLHWSLPAGLARAPAGGDFPRVPNEWLVSRRHGDEVERWIVESDYLAPDGELAGRVSYPFTPPDGAPRGARRYRYLGRNLPYDAWLHQGDAAEYLDRLTAVGYGEPSFAAFYPNCHGVFGFFDDAPALAASIPAGLVYEVIGWYRDPATDELARFLAAFRADFQGREGRAPTAAECRTAIEAAYGWTYPEGSATPDLLACYARLTFPQGGPPRENPARGAPVGVAVGQTGVEALSAWLAARLAPENKATVEDQLEAMTMGAEMGHRLLDIGPKFEEARHLRGFNAVDGGTRFMVRSASTPGQDADADAGPPRLPPALGPLLDTANTRMAELDGAEARIASLRRLTFADFYKYMLAVHPPTFDPLGVPSPDAIQAFVAGRDLPAVAAAIAAAGAISIRTGPGGAVVGASAEGAPGSIAGKLAAAIDALVAAVLAVNQGAGQGDPTWMVQAGAAPRTWKPTEPVVLLTGDAVEPAPRDDGDALLPCQILGVPAGTRLVPDDLAAIEAAIAAAAPPSGEQPGFALWTEEPWNPFLLQWAVEVFPTRDRGNLATPDRAYRPDFITYTYFLGDEAVDLAVRPDRGTVVRGASIYTGATVLSPHARVTIEEQVLAYLMEQTEVLDAFYAAEGVPPASQGAAYVVAHIGALETWYEAQYLPSATPAEKAQDPVETAIRTLALLPDVHALSQSLGGFNAALVMQKQTLQLEVDDPLAFADAVPFLAAVRGAVGDANETAPTPTADFNPIRSGVMRVERLRVVDTFGQVRDVDPRPLVTSTAYAHVGNDDLIELTPRLAQPARIDLRWLAAGGGRVEMNDAPSTSPISGFVVSNRLDRTLAIFDAAGAALGSIVPIASDPWEPAPGGAPLAPVDIPDPTLRAVVAFILDGGRPFQEAFVQAIDDAQLDIQPARFAETPSLAMLLGRPLAVVRCLVGLSLLGLPAVHHGWDAFRQDLRRGERQTDGFTEVRFPVRIGDARQYNDGLVGYWIEQDDGTLGEVFNAPRSDAGHDPRILTSGSVIAPEVSISGAPRTLTMLVDPLASVHAVSGVLPVKGIDIPADQYGDALAALELTFLTAPVLTPRAQVCLPVRDEPGYTWSFLSQRRDGWSEVSTIGVVRRLAVLNAFGEARGAVLWAELVDKGWLVPLHGDDGGATVTPKDRRPEPLGTAFAAEEPAIEALLLHASIGPVEQQAGSAAPQELVEGWLAVRPTPEAWFGAPPGSKKR